MIKFIMRLAAISIMVSVLMMPIFPIVAVTVTVLSISGLVPMSSLLIPLLMYFPLFAYSIFRKISFKL